MTGNLFGQTKLINLWNGKVLGSISQRQIQTDGCWMDLLIESASTFGLVLFQILVVLCIAGLTVGDQTLKTALHNPTHGLEHE
jgi:hypothetical protein